jgi:mRNA-degrading endonuclease toxin of MazEF toxin-antitoxin module
VGQRCVAPISSARLIAPTHVLLRRREAGLERASVIKAEQVTTLRKDRLEAKPLGGPLAPDRMLAVEKAVLCAIGVKID